MKDKNKVLPVAVPVEHISYWDYVAQRDADFAILERDYMPKEKVRGVLESLQGPIFALIYVEDLPKPLKEDARKEWYEALAQLGVEVEHAKDS